MTQAVAQRVLCPGQNGTLKCKVMNSDQIGWTVEGESAVYPGGRNPGADLEGPGGLGGSGPPPPSPPTSYEAPSSSSSSLCLSMVPHTTVSASACNQLESVRFDYNFFR